MKMPPALTVLAEAFIDVKELGPVEATPMLPSLLTYKREEVALSIFKPKLFPLVLFVRIPREVPPIVVEAGAIESKANGVVVPIAMLPSPLTKKIEPVALVILKA